MSAFFTRVIRKNNELTLSEKRLKAIVAFSEPLSEAMPLPVFYKDASGRYTGCNEAFSKFIGKDRSEIVGKTVFEISPQNFATKCKNKDLEILTSQLGDQSYEGTSLAAVPLDPAHSSSHRIRGVNVFRHPVAKA